MDHYQDFVSHNDLIADVQPVDRMCLWNTMTRVWSSGATGSVHKMDNIGVIWKWPSDHLKVCIQIKTAAPCIDQYTRTMLVLHTDILTDEQM